MENKSYESEFNKFLLLAEEQSSAFINNSEVEDGTNSSLKFHISSGDYFGTLASILHLLMDEKIAYNSRHKEALKNIADDLVYLQRNYRIIKR